MKHAFTERAAILALSFAIAAGAASVGADPATAASDYLKRIDALDKNGPQINAVITINNMAPALARRAHKKGLPLDGRTVLIKDNIETFEWPTTAGSLALKENNTERDAPLIARLRASGGVVLGKTNLSEWANFRSNTSTSGWSGVGGLTRNPHALDRTACGSSAGSGAAVAAGFAWAAIGTETNGSVTCPASVNGIVGFKPTVGMVSRTHVVPISASQDTAGPMTRDVTAAAQLLSAIAGHDPADPATRDADQYAIDFTLGLADYSLKGVRIGVMREQVGSNSGVKALFEQALKDLEHAGVVLVDIEYDWPDDYGRVAYESLLFEFRRDINAYLASLPGEALPKTLDDLVTFNQAHAESELRWFDQALFLNALRFTDEDAYAKGRAATLRASGPDGIDRLLGEHKVEFLIAPTAGPAWSIDLVNGDNFNGSIGAGSLPARAGYPHLTVPMGAVERLPVGLSIISGKWQDAAVLKAGAAYERARSATLANPAFEVWHPNASGVKP
ncbi:MAG: amidase [Gammaproteobacteria bacterium]